MIADAKVVLENKAATTAELKAAFEKLQTSSHKITEDLYKASSAQPDGSKDSGTNGGAGTGKSDEKKGDDVIDADFKDVN